MRRNAFVHNILTWNSTELVSRAAEIGPTMATACCRASSFFDSMFCQYLIVITLRSELNLHVSLAEPVCMAILRSQWVGHTLSWWRIEVKPEYKLCHFYNCSKTQSRVDSDAKRHIQAASVVMRLRHVHDVNVCRQPYAPQHCRLFRLFRCRTFCI